VTDDKYKSARLKIERAKQHVRELERLSRDIPSDAYTLSVDANSHAVKFTSKPLGPQFSLVFGDAVTNLRSSLDHCYAAATGADVERGGQVFFPIRDKREALVGSIQKGAKKKPIPQPLYDLIVDQICAYDGGHKTLGALNKLANLDKHRLLIAISGLIGVTLSYRHGGAIFDNCYFGSDTGKELYLSIAPGPVQFDSEPKPSLEVIIGEREPTIFYRKPAIPTLLGLADDVSSIIDAIALILPGVSGVDHSDPQNLGMGSETSPTNIP
jgi:hypothetical protein